MMFPKPEKKDKQPYQGLKSKGPKPKKEIAPWRQGILSSHQSTPGKSDRAVFPRSVVEAAIERSKEICQCCKSASCTTTHHVYGRGRGGRGVLSNAYRACGLCHLKIESNDDLKESIIEEYRQLYGDRFWFDEKDWEEHGRKENAIKAAEELKRQRMERINPVIDLIATASGRKLKSAEVRLLDSLDDNEISVFAKMMADVLSACQPEEPYKPPFGYGHFDD